MSDYPRMMYRKGVAGCEEIFGLKCETAIAETAEQERELAADKWVRSPFEAHGVEAPVADPVEESSPLEVEREALSGEVTQLTKDLDTVQRERLALTEELARERAAHEETKAKLAEAETLLAEATKPAEKPNDKPKAKESA